MPHAILVTAFNARLVAVMQRACLDAMPPRPLMVIPQLPEARQYLTDSTGAGRCPLAVVVDVRDCDGEDSLRFIEWIRSQGPPLSDIWILALVEGYSGHLEGDTGLFVLKHAHETTINTVLTLISLPPPEDHP